MSPRIRRELSSAEVLSLALDAVRASATAPNREAALDPVRRLLEGLDASTAARVAVALAVEAVWSLASSRPAAVAWVDRMRLEVLWAAS